jgi:hypothetical protein
LEKSSGGDRLVVKKRRDVKEFKYPVEAKLSRALVETLSIRMLFKPLTVLWVFHIAMGFLLISGLVMDLAAPWISSFTLGQFHGFAGAFFTIIFFVYIGIIAINKNFRELREPINYVEILFYAALILFGFAIRYPTLLPFLGPISPFHCNLLTYGWILVSTLGGGGIIQGVASIYYLFTHARSKVHKVQGPKEFKDK